MTGSRPGRKALPGSGAGLTERLPLSKSPRTLARAPRRDRPIDDACRASGDGRAASLVRAAGPDDLPAATSDRWCVQTSHRPAHPSAPLPRRGLPSPAGGRGWCARKSRRVRESIGASGERADDRRIHALGEDLPLIPTGAVTGLQLRSEGEAGAGSPGRSIGPRVPLGRRVSSPVPLPLPGTGFGVVSGHHARTRGRNGSGTRGAHRPRVPLGSRILSRAPTPSGDPIRPSPSGAGRRTGRPGRPGGAGS